MAANPRTQLTNQQANQLEVSSQPLQVPEESTLATSLLANLVEQSSETLLAHEEVVSAMTQPPDEVESEVVREVRELISNMREEGWLNTDTQMVYQTGESKWGGDGVPENDMIGIKQGATNKTPTNDDCIKYLHGNEEIDDPKVPDAIYYRRCK